MIKNTGLPLELKVYLPPVSVPGAQSPQSELTPWILTVFFIYTIQYYTNTHYLPKIA